MGMTLKFFPLENQEKLQVQRLRMLILWKEKNLIYHQSWHQNPHCMKNSGAVMMTT